MKAVKFCVVHLRSGCVTLELLSFVTLRASGGQHPRGRQDLNMQQDGSRACALSSQCWESRWQKSNNKLPLVALGIRSWLRVHCSMSQVLRTTNNSNTCYCFLFLCSSAPKLPRPSICTLKARFCSIRTESSTEAEEKERKHHSTELSAKHEMRSSRNTLTDNNTQRTSTHTVLKTKIVSNAPNNANQGQLTDTQRRGGFKIRSGRFLPE